MLEQVLDLDGDVVSQRGPFAVEGLDDGDSMAGAVEEIGVAEGDVLRAGGHLPADVLQYHLPLHDAENTPIDRDHRAMPADEFAAPAGFGGSGEAARAIGNPLGVRGS